MRIIAVAPLAIAATMGFSGLAMADEYTTQMNKEAYAISALSAEIAAQHGNAPLAGPLGYAAPTAAQASALRAFDTANSVRPTGRQDFGTHDRGISSN